MTLTQGQPFSKATKPLMRHNPYQLQCANPNSLGVISLTSNKLTMSILTLTQGHPFSKATMPLLRHIIPTSFNMLTQIVCELSHSQHKNNNVNCDLAPSSPIFESIQAPTETPYPYQFQCPSSNRLWVIHLQQKNNNVSCDLDSWSPIFKSYQDPTETQSLPVSMS